MIPSEMGVQHRIDEKMRENKKDLCHRFTDDFADGRLKLKEKWWASWPSVWQINPGISTQIGQQ